MKNYLITRRPDGTLHLLAQEQTKKGIVNTEMPGNASFDVKFDIGNFSKESEALAFAIMLHYYGASATDIAALAEAKRKTGPFLSAFLAHHQMPNPGAQYEISSDVIDRWATTL